MPPVVTVLLGCAAFAALYISISKVVKFFKPRAPQLFSKLGTGLVYVLVAFIICDIPIALFAAFDLIVPVDPIRHYFSDKRHPITQEQIFGALGFEYDSATPNKEQVGELIKTASLTMDEESQHFIDSLYLDYANDPSYRTGTELMQIAVSYDFPQEVSAYLISGIIPLAQTKYQILNTILAYYYHRRDYDKVMEAYQLAKSWKWDRDIGNGSLKDRHDAERNTVLSNSMQLAIRILEEQYQPVTDSIAGVILKHCAKGLKADYANEFFWDKRAQYAYQIGHPKADKYADGFIGRTKGWDGLFAKDYELAIYDRGGEVQGYQNRFFSDPLFLRYKSLLKKHRYRKAKKLLDLISALSTDVEFDPNDPYNGVHDTLVTSNRQYADIILAYSKYDLASLSENARLRFLMKDKEADDWFTGAFLTGVSYLSPTEGHMHHTIDYLFNENVVKVPDLASFMSVNYNNPDPRWIYNTALFLKGATYTLSGALEQAIFSSADMNLINNIKERKRDHVFNAKLKTDDGGYDTLDSLVDNNIGQRIKEKLSDCFVSYLDLQRALPENACSIEIVKVPSLSFKDDIYRAVIMRHGWDKPILVTLADSEEIDQLFVAGNYHSSPALYSTIWEPLKEWVLPNDVVYFAPDGVLSLVNIGASRDKEGNYLSDMYDIRQCVSTKSVFENQYDPALESIALFGGINYDDEVQLTAINDEPTYRSPGNPYQNTVFEYLKGTEEEVKTIYNNARNQKLHVKLFSGKEGTEYNFKNLTGEDISILHIATHGFYYNANSTRDLTFFEKMSIEDNPLNRCGLLLSGGNRAWRGESVPDQAEDGILLGSEIARMDLLNTDLVVLSACNTGLGDISEEGVSGLQMAFKQAGVKSILMTLGKVDDEATAFFMNHFYKSLFSENDKHTAYSQAVKAMRESDKYNDPRYWAQFVLID